MVWDSTINRYKCNKCGIVLNEEEDNIVQVQFGYIMDKGQSFEAHFDRPDRHYHQSCYDRR